MEKDGGSGEGGTVIDGVDIWEGEGWHQGRSIRKWKSIIQTPKQGAVCTPEIFCLSPLEGGCLDPLRMRCLSTLKRGFWIFLPSRRDCRLVSER